jgi:murein DD-endopeptidase MepM/ murein hydrolase activator NlpD
MRTIYEILRSKKGAVYKDKEIEKFSFLHTHPKIDKRAGQLAGTSRVVGDATPAVQDAVIDILIEVAARYKFSYRDVAHILLLCKAESGFNPDAAAGTTSAAGLGQYTEATVKEAAKDWISKKRLDFTLDLSGMYVMDAERGAFGVILSYMMAKEKSIKFFGSDYEKHLYIFHHEGWYFKPTSERMKSKKVGDVIKIINVKILPYLSVLEKLLSEKTKVAFKLLTKDDKPYLDQPYVAFYPKSSASLTSPKSLQLEKSKNTEYLFGRTNAEGKTGAVNVPALSEVIFVILNSDYKGLLSVAKNDDNKVHSVRRGDTLAKIAKDSHVTVEDLKKLNGLSDPNKIRVGQKIKIHTGQYLWRRPPMNLIANYLNQFLNIREAAAPAIIEHKRSHIALPNGNVAQRHAGESNLVAIRGGATSAQLSARKKIKDVPHKTVDKKIDKPVILDAEASGNSIKENLLFPLKFRPNESYREGARRFNSNRGHRRHAGCDLYAPVGTEIRAMADGVVVQCANFYWQTDVIEVDHGGFIVRYGEVVPRSETQRRDFAGTEIKRGEIIAHVGQLIKKDGTKYKHSMLHLEMYSTSNSPLKVPLTLTNNAPFLRRSDLIDPSDALDKCVMA